MHDFTGLTDLDLVRLQKEIRDSPFPEDKEFLNAILKELGKRQASRETSPNTTELPTVEEFKEAFKSLEGKE